MAARHGAALALRAALTFSCAVLVHGAVHAAGSGSFAWDSPAHAAMLACALVLLGGASIPMGLFASPSERRRRLALLRARQCAGPWSTMAAIATQAALATALLAAEGASLSPDRIVVAMFCGLAALAATTFALRGSSRKIAALLAACFATCDRTRAAFTARATDAGITRILVPYRLFAANRPPPAVV